MPEIVIYDLRCQVFQHLKRVGNDLCEQVGFPVDVFHWKTKHKKSSDACSVSRSGPVRLYGVQGP